MPEGGLGLEGRVAIVTGGTRGLGRAVVEQLLAEDALVLAVGSSPESAARLAGDLAAAGSRLAVAAQDMRAEDAGARLVAAALERWGRLDVVVNNASPFASRHRTLEPGRADWLDIVTAKLLGYWSLLVAAVPALTETRGAVTNVAGGAGIGASPGSPHVGAVNAAIISMTESYALKLARSGVRVNVVTPSSIDNERFASRAAARAAERGISLEAARAELSDRIPVGFPTSPDEIARVIVLLSSPTSRSLTGAHIVVGGASHLRGHGSGA